MYDLQAKTIVLLDALHLLMCLEGRSCIWHQIWFSSPYFIMTLLEYSYINCIQNEYMYSFFSPHDVWSDYNNSIVLLSKLYNFPFVVFCAYVFCFYFPCLLYNQPLGCFVSMQTNKELHCYIALPHAARSWLLTAEHRVQSPVAPCRLIISGGRSGAREFSPSSFGFPLLMIVLPLLHTHLLSLSWICDIPV